MALASCRRTRIPRIRRRPCQTTSSGPIPAWAISSIGSIPASPNYHGLQTSLNRRFIQGLQFGVSYTCRRRWTTRAATTVSCPPTSLTGTGCMARSVRPDPRRGRQLHLGSAAGEPVMPNAVVRAVLDNWQFSGIGTFASGTPTGVGLATRTTSIFPVAEMAPASISPDRWST